MFGKRKNLKRTDCTGFSLIEVLVAFSITAVALGIIFNIYAKGTTAAILGEEYAQAVAIAESRLAVLGISEELENTEIHGTDNDKYHWTISVNDYTDQTVSDFTSPLELRKVTVEVNWESRGKSRSIQLQTLKPSFPT